jgi:small subunit ribosomal protein S18
MSSNYDNRDRGGYDDRGRGGYNNRDDNDDYGGRGGGGDTRGGRAGGRRMHRRKICRFCIEKVDIIDFKDVKLLQNYIPERGKIMPRRLSGSCATHQRMLAEAIKRARIIALLPFAVD